MKKLPRKKSKSKLKFASSKLWRSMFGLGLFLIVGLIARNSQVGILFSNCCQVDFYAADGEFDAAEKLAVYRNQDLPLPVGLAESENESQVRVLGDQDTTTEKRIEVDLSGQRLFLYEGDQLVDYFIISSGKWGRTPTGEFEIWSKFRYTKMSGGSRALGTYYYLPNVPYVMFFANDQVTASRGFSIHGTYWHDNFGEPMSHGCINMKTEDVAKVYEWATPSLPEGKKSIRASKDNPGTKVIIYGQAPI